MSGEAQIFPAEEPFVGRAPVLRRIHDWLDSGDQLFVVRGEPGAGKTALAQHLWQLAEVPGDSGFPLGFLAWAHFCRVADAVSISPYVWAERLSSRLCHLYPAFRQAVEDTTGDGRITITGTAEATTVTGHGAVVGVQVTIFAGAMPVEEACRRLLTAPLAAARAAGLTDEIVILVDALDEGLADSSPVKIPQMVERLLRADDQFRALVTTRPDGQVLWHLHAGARSYDLAADDFDVTRSDIEALVVQTLGRRSDLVARLEPGLTVAEVAELIGTASAGNFLYASQVLQSRGDGADARITRDSLTGLPQSLDELYRGFLKQQCDPGKWLLVGPVAGALAVARSALLEGQLSRFSGCSDSIVRHVLEVALRQFVESDEERPNAERRYSVFHRSFAEFLLDKNRAGAYLCPANEAQDRLIGSYVSDGEPHWNEADDYGLLYLPEHAAALTDRGARLTQVLTGEFLAAKVDRFSYRAAMGDLSLATRAAWDRGDLTSMLWLSSTSQNLRSAVDDLPLNVVQELVGLQALTGRPDRALDIVGLLSTPLNRVTSLREIVRRLAPTDRDRAGEIARSIQNHLDRAESVEILAGCAAKDGDRQSAEAYLNELTSLVDSSDVTAEGDWGRYWRTARLRTAAATAASVGSPSAATFAHKALVAAQRISSPTWRWGELHALAGHVAPTFPQGAVELYREALRALAELPAEWTTAVWTVDTLRAMTQLDPVVARQAGEELASVVGRPLVQAHWAEMAAAAGDIQLADELIRLAVSAARQIRSLGKAEAPGWAESATARIASTVHHWDPDRAEQLIAPCSVLARDKARLEIAADPVTPIDQALRHARQIQADDPRAEALDAVAHRLLDQDPEAAWQLTQEQAEGTRRYRTLCEMGRVLAEHGNPLAERVLDDLVSAARAERLSRGFIAELADRLVPVRPSRAADLRRLALDPERSPDPRDRATAIATVAVAHWREGLPDDALSLAREGMRLMLISDEPQWSTLARSRLIGLVAENDLNAAAESVERMPEQGRFAGYAAALRGLAHRAPEQALKMLADTGWEALPSLDFFMPVSDILAAALLAAAREPGAELLTYCRRLWEYQGDKGFDVKSEAIAKAAGRVGAAAPALAEELLNVVFRGTFGFEYGMRELGAALTVMAESDRERAKRIAAAVAVSELQQGEAFAFCAAIAAPFPDLALSLAATGDSQAYGVAAHERGIVMTIAAGALAASERDRAQRILQKALDMSAQGSDKNILARLHVARGAAYTPWDAEAARREIGLALDLASDKDLYRYVQVRGQAAQVLRRLGHEDEALTTMRSIEGALSSPTRTDWDLDDGLDHAIEALEGWPGPRANELRRFLAGSVLLDGRLLVRRPQQVMDLVTGTGGGTDPLALLRGLDRAHSTAHTILSG